MLSFFSPMLPHHGRGFVWDPANHNGHRADVNVFVPEAKKIFYVSIATKEVQNWRNMLLPTQWIAWKSVGVRDASRATPLNDVTLVKEDKDELVHPEFSNQTTFKSVLLFPKNEELQNFIGTNNAWSPFVGIVHCDDTDIQRDKYCVGYIERDDNKPGTVFRTGSLKFPEGTAEGTEYCSDVDKMLFEGLERAIELAAEEAREVAAKNGGAVEEDAQVIPQRRIQNDVDSRIWSHADSTHAVKTTLGEYRWAKNKSEDEKKHILSISNFVKNKRIHDIIVYKEGGRRGGFIGFTPLIGSIFIRAENHKLTDQRVEVGQCLLTRVEFIKIACEYAVESISEIKEIPFIKFFIRVEPHRTELLMHCVDLDMSKFKVMNEVWKGKRVGTVQHPVLISVLVLESDYMNPQWKDKRVKALVLHYEGIENKTPGRLRLVVERIEGLADDGFDGYSSSMQNFVPIDSSRNGCPDDLESDYDDEDEDEEEEEEDDGYEDEDEEEEEDRTENDQEVEREMSKQDKKIRPARGYASYDEHNYGFAPAPQPNRGGHGFASSSQQPPAREQRGVFGAGRGDGYEPSPIQYNAYDQRGGFGAGRGEGYDFPSPFQNSHGDERSQGRGAFSQNRGNGFVPNQNRNEYDPRGDRRGGSGSSQGGWNDGSRHRSLQSYDSREPSEKSGQDHEMGLLVFYSRKSSLFYTDSEKIVEFEGDARDVGLNIGNWAKFYIDVKGPRSLIKFKVRRESVTKQSKFIKFEVYNDELYILNTGSLNSVRDTFTCKIVGEVKLGQNHTSMKLKSGEFVKITRLITGHEYDIWVKFNSDRLEWEYDSIETRMSSFQLEEEDEIDIIKKQMEQKEQPHGHPRSSSDSWEEMRSDLSDIPRSAFAPSRQSMDTRQRDTKFSRPSASRSQAPSVATAASRMTTTTVTTENSNKKLVREISQLKKMLKAVWAIEGVPETVLDNNDFLHQSVDAWCRAEEEDGMD